MTLLAITSTIHSELIHFSINMNCIKMKVIPNTVMDQMDIYFVQWFK